MRSVIGPVAVLVGLAIGAACVAAFGHAPAPSSRPSTPSKPTASPAPTVVTAPTATPQASGGDYYAVVGAAQRLYTPTAAGVVEYCPVDALGRAVCAYGELTSSQRAAVKGVEREPITVAPAGWGHNSTVTIPAVSGVPGSTTYRGWFWNRSHLVADSLGGAATAENLVTGTRMQNVGSTKVDGDYAGGMAAAETQARQYLDTHNGDACPLYYAATPQYTGDELIPRTVTVDIQSCDGAIDERVEISNTANGWAVDYRTGTFAPAR